jgi:DNA-directed RNA polymerase I subunit RPA2
VFRIQSPQSPLVRNETYDRYLHDEYPLGSNAIVAVISYTGYDMEDAMIINKSAAERGWGHASVYKYKKVDLEEHRTRGEPIHHKFANNAVARKGPKKPELDKDGTPKPESTKFDDTLDADGLPYVGTRAPLGTPLYAYNDDISNKTKVVKQKDKEECVVEEVRALSNGPGPLQKLGLKVRYNRNPILGDKFSSRHGQKGVLSQLWPQQDMPFSESGKPLMLLYNFTTFSFDTITATFIHRLEQRLISFPNTRSVTNTGMSPDVLINPHAFPSRMTIGMLIESMAGKAACLNGTKYDGTPFRFDEQHTAVDHFGNLLKDAGYNYAGTETLYSGYTGTVMTAEIFFGVVYYQRLRHMVSDKSQVRSTGPTNSITRQPVKGRKMGGGIRFGEMERDSLLAHGTPFNSPATF